ncbi:MAG: hypothetical protein K6T77_02005 [candidate division WOR-3 bacterium]|jgi:hypothetical protein|nr:hypothetical protein [candidate division WOR-3 bacterium]MCR4423205.1 hypothetical protein [candidate division WOR-3 bacterium]MDH7518544.1 hypothetical protein [bacterium]
MFSTDIKPERRAEIINKIAQKTVNLRLTPIAIVLLESVKPLSFVGSQLMVFFQPIITAIFPFHQYEEVAAILEERENIELLIQTIESLEENRSQGTKNEKQPSAKESKL